MILESGSERHNLRKQIPKYYLIVTNYALLRRDLEAFQKFAFSAVILDEAQFIKNPSAQVTQSVKKLKAGQRLALTGTPLENRLGKLKKEPGKPGEKALLEKCIPHLETGAPLSTLGLDAAGQGLLAGFGLLSTKPVLYLLNQAEEDITAGIPADLAAEVEGRSIMAISAQVEMDIAEMPPEEQPEFLEALGLENPARDRFVQAAYGLLDLIGFLTTGEDESRAWPIRRGTRAVKAAGKVHSDIERGFIRAEVIAYDALIALGGEKQARDAGKLRLEGKEYVVQDGDVINFRFNV